MIIEHIVANQQVRSTANIYSKQEPIFFMVQCTVLFSRLFNRIINIAMLRTLNLLVLNWLINIFGALHFKIISFIVFIIIY